MLKVIILSLKIEQDIYDKRFYEKMYNHQSELFVYLQ